MSVWRQRIGVRCLRNLIILFVIDACISHGLSQEINEAVVKKLFIPEKDISKVNLVQSSTTLSSNKNKISSSNNEFSNDSRRQRISSNLRLKRNTLLADEDLFEFMVRIANTPAEWERIRRVLSRIKQEEIVKSTLPLQPVSSVAPQPVTNFTRQNSTSISQLKRWPSSEWIKTMIENVTKKLSNSYIDEDDDEEPGDSDFEFIDDETNRVGSFDSSDETDTKNKTIGRMNKATNEDNNRLTPNSDLPNFVYRQANAPNSAYIAVSVMSNTNTSVNTTTKRTEVDESTTYRKKALLELETRRRHLKKRIHKT